MNIAKQQTIARVKKDILSLQGFKTLGANESISIGIPPIEAAFPNAVFPLGCMHEFISSSVEDTSATNGFIAGLLSKVMNLGDACVWVSSSRTLFPPALKRFGVEPHQIIFIDLQKERDVLQATEEALKCSKLRAVLGDIQEIDFKTSRRFQLAAEQSKVTGFIIRNQPRILNTIASVSRWRITSLPSELQDAMPGIGFPRWNVELLKVRNGLPGSWQIEWDSGGFTEIRKDIVSIPVVQIRKAG